MGTITKYVLYVDSAQRTGVTLGQGGRKERRGKRGQEERKMRGYHGKGKGETGADSERKAETDFYRCNLLLLPPFRLFSILPFPSSHLVT